MISLHLEFSSVQSLSPFLSSLRPHESQHARPPCPSPTPGVYPNSCPSSWWCHPAISSSVVPFSSCPQSLPASESFPMSQLWWGTCCCCCCCCCYVTSVVSNSVRPHRQKPTRLPSPWDSPGKNTGVGCHFLFQCMKQGTQSWYTGTTLTPWKRLWCWEGLGAGGEGDDRGWDG